MNFVCGFSPESRNRLKHNTVTFNFSKIFDIDFVGIVERFLVRETYRILIIVKYLIMRAIDEYQSKVNVLRFNRKTAKIFIRPQFSYKSRNVTKSFVAEYYFTLTFFFSQRITQLIMHRGNPIFALNSFVNYASFDNRTFSLVNKFRQTRRYKRNSH